MDNKIIHDNIQYISNEINYLRAHSSMFSSKIMPTHDGEKKHGE